MAKAPNYLSGKQPDDPHDETELWHQDTWEDVPPPPGMIAAAFMYLCAFIAIMALTYWILS